MTRASTILGALEAIRNVHAGILVALVFITTALVFALFSYLAAIGGGVAVAALGGLLVFLISVYGSSAVGYMLMNDAKGAAPLSIVEALLLSLRTTHRWLAVMILALLVFVLFALVLLLILFVCKIPFVGPVLYAVVLPVATLATAAFIAALYFVVMPLSFPAVWAGDTALQAVAKLWAIVRQRLVQVVVLVLLLALLCLVIGGVISLFTLGALGIVGGLSAVLLPTGGGIGGLMSGMMMGGGREGAGYLTAGVIGSAIVFAIVAIAPFLVLLRGYCLIYLEVIQGIDFSAAEAQLKSGMDNLQRQAREAQERAREKMQAPAPPPAAPAPGPQPEAQTAAPSAPAAGAVGSAAGKCPQCGAAHLSRRSRRCTRSPGRPDGSRCPPGATPRRRRCCCWDRASSDNAGNADTHPGARARRAARSPPRPATPP
jgi:hypothetical protein